MMTIYRTKFRKENENWSGETQMPCYRCAEWYSNFQGEGSWDVTKFSWRIFFEWINPFCINKRTPFYKKVVICEECKGTGWMWY